MSRLKKAVAGLVALPLAATMLPMVATPASAAPADGQAAAAYLSVHFLQTDYENIHFGFSEDGLNWSKLNNDKPIVRSNVGEKSIRDPHVMRLEQPDADGNNFVILGTDYHAQGSAGGASWSQFGRSQSLVVSKSKDLVDWTDPEIVFAGLDSAGCAWAPEAIWDPEVGRYLVYWSGRDANEGTSTGTTNLRVYKTYTDDFTAFDQAEVWIDQSATGKNTAGNIIDTHVEIGDDGDYYRFSTSDWRTVIDTASSLSGPWTRLVERDNAIVDGKSIIPEFAGQEVRTDTQVGVNGGEGWTGFHGPDGQFIGFIDQEGLKSFTIDKLSSLKTGGVFTAAGATFSGHFRHGSVLELTEAEKAAVLAAYGPKEPTRDENEQADPIAKYTFEDSAGTDEVGDADLALNGTAAVVDDADRGKILKLDGTTDSFAAFPQGFFDNRDYMTVSMDVKTESTGNHFTFTFGKDNTTYFFSKYSTDGTLNSRISTGSWGAEKKTDAKVADGDWKKVTWVFAGRDLTVYADGEQVAKNSDLGLFVGDLGKDLLGYLGKSFYPDPYSKASYDNIMIWNRDLSGDEVRALSNLDPIDPVDPPEGPVLLAEYDFEDGTPRDLTGNGNDLTLVGNAIEVYGDKPEGSRALSFRGGTQHATFPQGMFDGQDEFTFEMNYKNRESNGNFFTFAIGQDQNKYVYLRTRYQELTTAITKQTHNNESKATAALPSSIQNQWHTIRTTVSPSEIVIYLDGKMVARQKNVGTTVSELGTNLIGYLGRSFYSADPYFNGAMDDIKVWSGINAHPRDLEVERTEQVLASRVVDQEDGSKLLDVTLDYWGETGNVDNSKADLSNVKITYLHDDDETLVVKETGAPANDHRDYTSPVTMELTKADGTTVDYVVSPVVLHTPARVANEKDATGVTGKKFFADPEIFADGDAYYVYATTDSHADWRGTQVRGFKSYDMVTWEDMGPMVDLANKVVDDLGGDISRRTEKGWAPAMIKANDKYYLYFSGQGETNVAISDRPDGGFKIWTGTNPGLGANAPAGKVSGSIDPAIFEDPANPGDFYYAWGQSGIQYVKMNDDLTGWDADATVVKQSIPDFREAAFMTAREYLGEWTYYFSYSKWDTNETRYKVAYATAKSMAGPWTYQGELTQPNADLGIMGPGHHSFVQVPGTDDWYIAHHVFLTDEMRPRLKDLQYNKQINFGNKREIMFRKISYTEPTAEELANGAVPLINEIPVVREPVAPERIPALTLAEDSGTLTASFNETWEGETFEWLRDGEKIENADGASYAITDADAGTTITVNAIGRSSSGVPNNAGDGPSLTNTLTQTFDVPARQADPKIVSWSIDNVRTGYSAGNDFDPATVKVSATFDDGETRELDAAAGEFTVTAPNMDGLGNRTGSIAVSEDLLAEGVQQAKTFTVTVAANLIRYSGDSRAETSLEVLRAEAITGKPVFVVGSYAMADAMAAAPVAAKTEGVVALVGKDEVDSEMVQAIKDAAPSEVYVIGGSGVVSDAVVQTINAEVGKDAQRVFGDTRYETAAAVADRFYDADTEGVLVTSGEGIIDAVAGSVVAGQEGWPLLYAADAAATLPKVTSDAIAKLEPTQALVAGGNGRVSDSVVKEMEDLQLDVTRKSGDSRYATAAALSELVKPAAGGAWKDSGVVMVYGYGEPDALSIASVAARKGWAIQLTDISCVPQASAAGIDAGHATRLAVGGTGVVSDEAHKDLARCTW